MEGEPNSEWRLPAFFLQGRRRRTKLEVEDEQQLQSDDDWRLMRRVQIIPDVIHDASIGQALSTDAIAIRHGLCIILSLNA